MRFPAMITISEGVSGILIAATWWWVVRQHVMYAGWRRKASLLALAVATVALALEFLLAVVLHLRSLDALDAASRQGGWPAFVGRAWIWSFMATGVLSFCGLMLAALGQGSPRLAGALWSSLVLGFFIVSLVLAVNSFH
jgi:hypothetical protein